MSNFLFRNRDKAVFVLFLGIPVFSTYLLFSRKPIWMDEVLTIVNATSGGFWEVVQGIYYGGTETHPPFYFLLARAISLFTDNLFGALRYFSAICLGLAWFAILYLPLITVIDEEKRKWFEVRIKNNPIFVYKVINKDLDSLTKLSYPREPIRLLFVERKAK